ncbi:MAG: PorT family protein [Cyclobacteriaceae bacterium]|nr:PorT family protein [Cyclobacteriaceae bacterium]MCK5705756.1 PorT family protein [Cyclobacteriaceae bacterium]
MKILSPFLLFVFLISTIPAFAQDQCAISLSEAEDKYDQGHLYEIPGIIQSCLNEGFTKEEKVRAYRLLTLSYLFLNYYEEADKSYLELLKLSPEFKTNDELDPMEIINLHDKYTTKPIFYLTYGKIGFNYSYANVLLDYSISQSDNKSAKYSSVPGFQLGLGAEMVIYQNLHLSGEIFVSRKSLHFTDTHWDFYTTNMDIIHTDIELPIMLKYNFFRGVVNPFVSAGVSPAFLAESSIQNIEGVYRDEEDGEFPVQPRPEIGTGKMKNRFNYSILFGGGVNYKIGLTYLVFEARYSIGMLNVTDVKKRWREDFTEGRDLKFPTGHIDDDFKINNFSFLIGFVRPLYKPRKIK